MATNQIGLVNGRPLGYDEYTMLGFSSWRALQQFAKYGELTSTSTTLARANNAFAEFINGKLSSGDVLSYGLWGKHPKTYEEAMTREKFVYFDEYKRIKNIVEKKIMAELQKNSIVQAMRPKLVLNDRELGDFQFDRASMALEPELFFYSPSQKREIDALNEKIIYKDDKMFLEDGSEVVRAMKVTKEDGSIEYVEAKGEESLIEASEKGIVSCTSSNKKVYLYKQKQPKVHKGIKIIVGLTAGGFTSWINDFFTGIAAASCIEILESLDYSVHVEVVVGGGRCGGCSRKLNFGGVKKKGRRFFSFPIKTFDEQTDIQGLLYTLCDPSFHNVKFISLLNSIFTLFGDQLDTRPNPSSTWHGIEEFDMVVPIGQFHKRKDLARGDKNLLHFYIHKVGLQSRTATQEEFIRAGEQAVINQVTDLVLECENMNYIALQKALNQ